MSETTHVPKDVVEEQIHTEKADILNVGPVMSRRQFLRGAAGVTAVGAAIAVEQTAPGLFKRAWQGIRSLAGAENFKTEEDKRQEVEGVLNMEIGEEYSAEVQVFDEVGRYILHISQRHLHPGNTNGKDFSVLSSPEETVKNQSQIEELLRRMVAEKDLRVVAVEGFTTKLVKNAREIRDINNKLESLVNGEDGAIKVAEVCMQWYGQKLNDYFTRYPTIRRMRDYVIRNRIEQVLAKQDSEQTEDTNSTTGYLKSIKSSIDLGASESDYNALIEIGAAGILFFENLIDIEEAETQEANREVIVALSNLEGNTDSTKTEDLKEKFAVAQSNREQTAIDVVKQKPRGGKVRVLVYGGWHNFSEEAKRSGTGLIKIEPKE